MRADASYRLQKCKPNKCPALWLLEKASGGDNRGSGSVAMPRAFAAREKMTALTRLDEKGNTTISPRVSDYTNGAHFFPSNISFWNVTPFAFPPKTCSVFLWTLSLSEKYKQKIKCLDNAGFDRDRMVVGFGVFFQSLGVEKVEKIFLKKRVKFLFILTQL